MPYDVFILLGKFKAKVACGIPVAAQLVNMLLSASTALFCNEVPTACADCLSALLDCGL
jgi:hypothetical protein